VGLPPAPCPTSSTLPDEVALDENSVGGALNLGQRMVERHHRRMNPCFDAAGMPLRVGDELDRVAQLPRVLEVDRLDALDTLAEDVGRTDLDLVSDRPEDRQLVSRVETADVVGGVRLREPCNLRLADRFIHGQSCGSHPAEHVVGGSVDHGGEALDAVGLEVGAECADQRYAAAHCRLEIDVDVLLGGEVEQLRTVLGHHHLVSSHHMLA